MPRVKRSRSEEQEEDLKAVLVQRPAQAGLIGPANTLRTENLCEGTGHRLLLLCPEVCRICVCALPGIRAAGAEYGRMKGLEINRMNGCHPSVSLISSGWKHSEVDLEHIKQMIAYAAAPGVACVPDGLMRCVCVCSCRHLPARMPACPPPCPLLLLTCRFSVQEDALYLPACKEGWAVLPPGD